MARVYDLFISHSWSYTDAYEKFCKLLNNANYFTYRNYSIPKDNPVHTSGTDRELYEAIKNKMLGTDIILIMTGKYATFSKWIKNEIKIAKSEFSNPKPILGIKPWADTQVSSVVAGAADELVNWSTTSIVGAIRRLAL